MENQNGNGNPSTPPAGEPGKSPETITLTKAEHEELLKAKEANPHLFERAKKAELEAKELRTQLSDNVPLEPENAEEVGKLKETVSNLSKKVEKGELVEQYPILKEVWSDFESFHALEDNKGLSVKTAVKAFLTEKNLLAPSRPGVEPNRGGDRTPQPSGMTAEEAKQLRETNFKKYSDMLRKGQIQVS